MIKQITRAGVRHYSDTGQTTAYVEWTDHRGAQGRTEGAVQRRRADPPDQPAGPHMQSLFARAVREGLTVEFETW